MNVMWKAACAAALIAAMSIEIGCGDVYRPVSTPLPVITGNPSGAETEVVLHQCPSGLVCTGPTGIASASLVTAIDVSGDSNGGDKPLNNQVGKPGTPAQSVAGPVAGSQGNPIAFDFSRSSVFTANTTTNSVSQVLLTPSTAGFSATTTTISLETGSQPIAMSFEYAGLTYTQDYVVNSGANATCPNGGSLGVITQATALLKATVCLGVSADPVAAWIYKDQSKVFVLDFNLSQVYVVSASKYQLTHTIALPAGSGPIKVAQSNNGQYIYVLNSNGSISILDGQAEQLVPFGTNPVSTHITGSGPLADVLTNSPPVDIAMDTNFNDTTANTQINHVWILHANGAVSVFDGTAPGTLTWVTSIDTGGPSTNLALLRDGTWAYVGLAGTAKIVGIDTSKLSHGAVTPNATTTITVGVHRTVSVTGQSCIAATGAGCLEVTTPVVNSVAVSRQGDSADLSKVYATTTTLTTFYYPTTRPPLDPTPAWCTDNANTTSCPNLYNGTAVVAAANIGAVTEGNTVIVPAIPINTYIVTIPAPTAVSYCDPGNPATGEYDGQKNCPAMAPVLVLGRS